MRQISAALVGAIVICIALLSCDKPKNATGVKHPTIACLVPAATDILVEMHAGDHLVAVSNFDDRNPAVKNLPRVGDYLTVDWEKISELRPDAMIIQMNEQSIPQALRDRCQALGAKLINIKLDSLEDVRTVTTRLGDLAGEHAKGIAANERLNNRLARIAEKAKSMSSVKVLLCLDDHATEVIGPGGFLDSILQIAGGSNAAANLSARYASIDREKLVAMNPGVVIALLPGGKTSAEEVLSNLPEIDARKNRRVYVLTQWYLLLCGLHIADTAGDIQQIILQQSHDEH